MIKHIFLKRLIAWTLCLLLTPVWGAERTTYYHLDLLGSPVAATDSNGQVIWREEYKPYGERTLGQDQSASAPGYTGKVHEEALGLSYYGARWYDPELGRFTGIDPVDVDANNIHSFNRYAYANNNPYKYIDPDGQAAELAILAGVAAILYLSIAVLPGHEQRADSLRQWLKTFNESSEGDKEAADDSGSSDKTNKNTNRPSNVNNPEEALDSIEKAAEKLKKSRPSITDQNSDWEGAKKRPKQTAISSTEKSRQRGANDRNRRVRENGDGE